MLRHPLLPVPQGGQDRSQFALVEIHWRAPFAFIKPQDSPRCLRPSATLWRPCFASWRSTDRAAVVGPKTEQDNGERHRQGRIQYGAAPRRLLSAFDALEQDRSEEHTSELQSLAYLVCRLLLEKKKKLEK